VLECPILAPGRRSKGTVFTAFIGLSGTVLGFYFGGKDNTS
jgi:hypothetical protein